MDITGQPIELRDDQCGLGLLGSRDGSGKLRPVGTLAALDFAELGLKRPTVVGKVRPHGLTLRI